MGRPKKYLTEGARQDAIRGNLKRYYRRSRKKILAKQKRARPAKRTQDRKRLVLWRKRNPDQSLREQLWRTGNLITVEEFRRLERVQNGTCKLCGGLPPKGRRLSVDHCHTRNKFRGLLCVKCNSGLGFFRESVSLMRRAIEYINKEGKLE